MYSVTRWNQCCSFIRVDTVVKCIQICPVLTTSVKWSAFHDLCKSFQSTFLLCNARSLSYGKSCLSPHLRDSGVCVPEKHQVFEHPKQALNDLFLILGSQLDTSYRIKKAFDTIGNSRNRSFSCVLTLTWPENLKFEGHGRSKKLAELACCCKALDFLLSEGHITAEGKPVLYSQHEMVELKNRWKAPTMITFPDSAIEEGQRLIENFAQVRPLLRRFQPFPAAEGDSPSLFSSYEVEEEHQSENSYASWNLMTGKHYFDISKEKSQRRNISLVLSLDRRKDNIDHYAQKGLQLPIMNYSKSVIDAVKNNPFVLVKGDTGCGKSTQVPQIIFDDWIQDGNGSECNIVITQPRRIAAYSLASRVAEERGDKVGGMVGYCMRMDNKFLRQEGGIMFYTAGMLLNALQHNRLLTGVSHVIIDEVHERSIETDLLMFMVHKLVTVRPDLKVILMSASVSHSEYLEYFGFENCSLVEVPGSLFPLKRKFLLETLEDLGLHFRYSKESVPSPPNMCFTPTELVHDIILKIAETKPGGAILVFLPSWADIQAVHQLLCQYKEYDSLSVHLLHSIIPRSQQERVFGPAEQGKRKVVLATNIAETSITIDDIVYVVDCGLHRDMRFNPRRNICSFGIHWISKANATQRAGRAGRVQPGEVFHLYTKETFSHLENYPQPDSLKIPLESVILKVKSLTKESRVLDVLSKMMDPPPEKSVQQALLNLESLGMIAIHQDQELLTPLGMAASRLPLSPSVTKSLVYSVLFRCVDPLLTYAAQQDASKGIFLEKISNEDHRSFRAQFSRESDTLAFIKFMRKVEDSQDWDEKRELLQHHYVCNRRIGVIEKLKQHYLEQLSSGLLNTVASQKQMNSLSWKDLNENRTVEPIILGVILMGISPILKVRRGIVRNGIFNPHATDVVSEHGQYVRLERSSVVSTLMKGKGTKIDYLMSADLSYCEISRRLVARENSTLSPTIMALFYGRQLTMSEESENVILEVEDKKVSFQCDRRTATVLLKLREMMTGLLDHELLNALNPEEELLQDNPSDETLRDFRDSFVNYFICLLNPLQCKYTS